MRVTFRIAPWKTMRVPTQNAIDRLIERICDTRTKASRERLQGTNLRRPWNTTRVST
jgi:hypothetical protein